MLAAVEMDRSDSARAIIALMVIEGRAAIPTLQGWVSAMLLETGAIRECAEHGWIVDSADPHARDRALVIARQDSLSASPPDGGDCGYGGLSRIDRRQLPGVRSSLRPAEVQESQQFQSN